MRAAAAVGTAQRTHGRQQIWFVTAFLVLSCNLGHPTCHPDVSSFLVHLDQLSLLDAVATAAKTPPPSEGSSSGFFCSFCVSFVMASPHDPLPVLFYFLVFVSHYSIRCNLLGHRCVFRSNQGFAAIGEDSSKWSLCNLQEAGLHNFSLPVVFHAVKCGFYIFSMQSPQHDVPTWELVRVVLSFFSLTAAEREFPNDWISHPRGVLESLQVGLESQQSVCGLAWCVLVSLFIGMFSLRDPVMVLVRLVKGRNNECHG